MVKKQTYGPKALGFLTAISLSLPLFCLLLPLKSFMVLKSYLEPLNIKERLHLFIWQMLTSSSYTGDTQQSISGVKHLAQTPNSHSWGVLGFKPTTS